MSGKKRFSSTINPAVRVKKIKAITGAVLKNFIKPFSESILGGHNPCP